MSFADSMSGSKARKVGFISSRDTPSGTDLDDQGGTSFWPVGTTVKGRELPDTLDEEDVWELIYRAIKDGERTPQGQKFKNYFERTDNGYPNSGINAMRVYVKPDGQVETAFPLSGEALAKWANGQWVEQR